jgi:outer membrane protein assembly factor BamB
MIAGCAALLLAGASCKQKTSQQETEQPESVAVEKLLLGGSGWNKVVVIDKDTKQVEWEYPIAEGEECNSVVSVPGGSVLLSYRGGAKLVDKDKNIVWNIEAPDGAEMQTVRQLPDGNYLLAWCGHPATILEVNQNGEILSMTEYETGIETPHAQFRQVNKNDNGNYLLPLFATSEVREESPKGELVKTIALEGTPFTTLKKADGNYWVACGDAHSLVDVNLESGEVAKKYGENDIEGAKLFFVASLYPTKDGGLYVANWQGHDPNAVEANSPQLFEIDKDGNIVWSINDNQNFGMISAVDVVK